MVRATTGANIQVWREGDTYSAQRAGAGDERGEGCIGDEPGEGDERGEGRIGDEPGEPQTCWDVDLFEVIAELAGLDLERSTEALEAVALAERAIAALEDGQPEREDQGEPPAFGQGRG